MSELARRRQRDKSSSNMSNWSPLPTHSEQEMGGGMVDQGLGDYDVIFY